MSGFARRGSVPLYVVAQPRRNAADKPLAMSNAATLPTIGSIFRDNLRKAALQPSPRSVPPARTTQIQPTTAPPSVSVRIAAVTASPPPQPQHRGLAAPVCVTLDTILLEILDAPLPPGHNAASGYNLKEEALGAVMSRLSLDECRTLYKRLATPVDGDELAAKFTSRLVGERRNRLLVFLANARRRQVLAQRK